MQFHFLSIFYLIFSVIFLTTILVGSQFIAAIARTVGHLSKSAEVMKLVNNLMKAPEVAVTMQEFSKEMTKVLILLNDGADRGLKKNLIF